MVLDLSKVMAWRFEEVRSSYTERDVMLYALGLGLSRDPCDLEDLAFTAAPVPKTLPTMAAVIARPKPWLQAIGIDVKDGLHASQKMVFDRALPQAASVRANFRIERIVDKGAGKGAFVVLLQEIFDDSSGERLCALVWTNYVRGGGGFGGDPKGLADAEPSPARDPDHIVDFPIDMRTPLIYRLSGDLNSLHADPLVARAAGFDRPIVHGFCTFGIAGWLLLKTFAAYDPSRLASIESRFSAPLYPGEKLRFSFWSEPAGIRFEGRALERDTLVIANGVATLRT